MSFVKPGTPATRFTLVHISDFHICRPSGSPARLFTNKRFFSRMSWCLHRRQEHRPEVLSALIRAVGRVGADLIAVTGDLTQLALPAEFKHARACLEELGPPGNVFVIPGNHDALVAAAWEESFAHWADYMASDAPGPDDRPVYPASRVRGSVAVFGLTTAHPTRVFSAAGSLGPAQLERLAARLDEATAAQACRVLLIHHPPLKRAVSPRKRLTDGDAFRAVIAAHGAELILHGHSHLSTRASLPGPSGETPVFGVSSASAADGTPERRAGFRVFRISGVPGAWQITVQHHAGPAADGDFQAGPETPA
jgi:3',5'-cyclic AMP phosphodiesterase CpdA